MLFFFSYTHLGIGAPMTDTTRLQLPVDCVLAGQQEDDEGKKQFTLKRGHAHYRALRGIFRE